MCYIFIVLVQLATVDVWVSYSSVEDTGVSSFPCFSITYQYYVCRGKRALTRPHTILPQYEKSHVNLSEPIGIHFSHWYYYNILCTKYVQKDCA